MEVIAYLASTNPVPGSGNTLLSLVIIAVSSRFYKCEE
jgi:hypothetical protein